MSQRMSLRPVLLCSAIFAMAQMAPAQTKVAVVNLQQAVFSSAEIKKADAEMVAKYKPRQDALDKLAAEGTALNEKLQAGQGKLTAQAEGDLQTQIARVQRDYQRAQEDLQADTERDRNEILSKSSQKMGEVIKKLAETQGFDLVVDTSNTLYFKPAMDITQNAIEAYDKAYPVAAAPAPAAAPKPPAK